MRDLDEDADAFDIASTLRQNKNAALGALAEKYFSPHGRDGTYNTRFLEFYKGRFGGIFSQARDEACRLLTAKDSALLQFARWYITGYSKSPSHLDTKQLKRFCKGLATVIETLAKQQLSLPPPLTAQTTKKPWIFHVNNNAGKAGIQREPSSTVALPVENPTLSFSRAAFG